MSEQFLKAWSGDLAKLNEVVGKEDDKLLARMLRHDIAEEVGDLLSEFDLDLEQILRELLAGKLQKKHAYGYRRAIELVASVVMKPIASEVTLPGRGWQDLARAFEHWGAKSLATIWGTSIAWPSKKESVEWPLAYAIPKSKTAKLRKELAALTEKRSSRKGSRRRSIASRTTGPSKISPAKSRMPQRS